MKSTAALLSVTILLAAPAALAGPGQEDAQPNAPSKPGQPRHIQASANPAKAGETAPAKLTAVLHPAKKHPAVKGSVEFSQTGDMLNVTGRIDGLEPMRQYALFLEPAFEAPPPAPTRNPGAGTPEAAPPAAGTPRAGTPDAGTPDGEARSVGGNIDPSAVPVPPAPGPLPDAASGPGAAGNFAILTPDSTGGVNINATIPHANLAQGPNGVLGRSVMLKSANAAEGAMAGEIARGKIVAARDVRDVPQEKPAPGRAGGANPNAAAPIQPLPPAKPEKN